MAAENGKTQETEVIRGGLPAAAIGLAERTLRDAAALNSQHRVPFASSHPHDPLTGPKRTMGTALVAISVDQSLIALQEGRNADAAKHGAIAATGIPVVSSKAAEALAIGANQLPVARQASESLARTLDKAQIHVPGGRVPVGGAALTGVTGLVAVAEGIRQGDYVKAGGDLLVTVVQAGVVVGGLVAGVAVCTPTAASTGPAAPLTGAVCARAAQIATFAAAEAATEATARIYNWAANRDAVRGSTIGTIVQYVANRAPSNAEEMKRREQYLTAAYSERARSNRSVDLGLNGIEVWPGCIDMTEWHDATTQLFGPGCPKPTEKSPKRRS